MTKNTTELAYSIECLRFEILYVNFQNIRSHSHSVSMFIRANIFIRQTNYTFLTLICSIDWFPCDVPFFRAVTFLMNSLVSFTLLLVKLLKNQNTIYFKLIEQVVSFFSSSRRCSFIAKKEIYNWDLYRIMKGAFNLMSLRLIFFALTYNRTLTGWV